MAKARPSAICASQRPRGRPLRARRQAADRRVVLREDERRRHRPFGHPGVAGEQVGPARSAPPSSGGRAQRSAPACPSTPIRGLRPGPRAVARAVQLRQGLDQGIQVRFRPSVRSFIGSSLANSRRDSRHRSARSTTACRPSTATIIPGPPSPSTSPRSPIDGDQLRVLLVRRGRDPFAGSWALPGGFLEIDEEPEAGARRELLEETGVELPAPVRPIGFYADPGRDPRGRTISLAFFATVRRRPARIRAGDDAAEAAWRPVVGPTPRSPSTMPGSSRRP